jgi:hypothetical protein
MARDPARLRKAYEVKLGKKLADKLSDAHIAQLSKYYNSLNEREQSKLDSELIQGRSNDFTDIARGLAGEFDEKGNIGNVTTKNVKAAKKSNKKQQQIPDGLDDLLKEIRDDVDTLKKEKGGDKKGKTTAIVKSVTQKKTTPPKSEDVDPRILSLLGLEDVSDLDYDTYKTLLKERMMAARMSGSKIPTEESELIDDEYKKVKSKSGRFKPKSRKKTVRTSNFVNRKSKSKPTGPTKVQTDKLLPSSTSSASNVPESVKADLQEDVQEKLVPISKSLTNIDKNLQKLLKINQDKLELEKETARKLAAKEETEGFREKEAKLEARDKKKGEKIEKALKPVKGIFDMIGDFFKNILLGGAINLILDIVQNPGKYLKPIIDFGNSIVDFLNNIINFINNTVLYPINVYINTLNSAFNELEFALKQIQKIVPIIQVPKFPDIPNIAIPNIPQIPYPQWMQQQEGGGQVVDIKNLSLFDGGAIDKMTGMTIKGMGKDTQLIAAQPGEIMMSKKAVDMYGADNLLAANAMAGGSNKPKFGKIQGFQGGGQVGKVIIGAGHAPTVSNAARGIGLGSDNRSVQGTADDGSSGGNTNPTGVKEWEATRHVVSTLKTLVQQRGLSDKIGFRDIYSWSGLSQVPQEVESVRGQQYVDLHFDARGFGKAGVLPSANESATDRSLMNEFGRYSSSFDPSSKGVTRGGGTLLELARIDDPAIRGLLEEVKRGTQGPHSLRMAEKILRGILPSVGASPVQADDLSGAPPAPVLPPPPGAQVSRPQLNMNIHPYQPQGGGTAVLPVPMGGQTTNSAASAAQKQVPGFSAEDLNNFDLIVVKSIYNIVG